MREEHIKHFMAVSEYRSFRAAAKACKITQPALSRSIQALETELGVGLFERSNKQIKLTEAGTTFFFHAKQLDAQYRSMRTEIEAVKSEELTTINIGVGTPALRFLSVACARFAVKYPSITQHMHCSNWYEITEKLRAGRLDVIVSNIDDYRSDEDLRIVDLSPSKLTFFARPEHPIFSLEEELTSDDVANFPLVAGLLPRSLNPMFQQMFGVNDANQQVTVNCENMHEMLEYVKSGDLIGTFISNLLQKYVKSGEVKEIILPEMQDEWSFYSLVTRKTHSLHPKIIELISMIRGAEREMHSGSI